MSSRIELVFIENCSKCDIEVKSSDILCDPVVCKDCFSEELSLDEEENESEDEKSEDENESEDDEKLEQVPSKIKDRIVGKKYLYGKQEKRIWDGKILRCEHNKRKNYCKECNGASRCIHEKIKSRCKECNGSQICKHNIERYVCKPCGGKGICVHNIQKNRCRPCGGSQICEHNIERSTCKPCKGSQICEHDRRRSQCPDCDGASTCEHKRQKRFCPDCDGNCICIHEIRKSRCRLCGGGSICKHDKERIYCHECGGSQICPCNIVKTACYKHSTNKQNFCQSCKFVYVKGCPYYPFCVGCYRVSHPDTEITRRYRLKEQHVYKYLSNEEYKFNYKFEYDKKIDDGCSRKRPDFFFECYTHSVIVEVDEEQHKGYDSVCEQKRLYQLFEDLADRPLVIIRFNPDAYKKGKKEKVNGCFSSDDKKNLIVDEQEFNYRMRDLILFLDFHLNNIPSELFTEVKLFYDE